MPEMEAHPVLPKMIELQKTRDSALYLPRGWLILEKLSEHPTPVTREDFDNGMGPAYTSGKYLCRLAGAGNEGKLAYMRIYKQIPLAGTELDNLDVRKAQASESRNHVELDALKYLTENRCTATPKLRGYGIEKQDSTTLSPADISCTLYGKRSQEILLILKSSGTFPTTNERSSVTTSKRPTRLRFGYELSLATAPKIILDKATGDVKISGFRRAGRIPRNTGWDDYNFVMFFLVLTSPARYQYIPTMANDLKQGEGNGWIW
ncbi:uncharacterized protein N7515_005520 [Penicillium bovifimosum]|uniref:Uncharacterized protein n=1 Tax=Penicillium bovifimosum TaxID=126998 RepID=A0A9W9GT70_9EURO|nr:uncharacterized protein N7515_005520 [Penicillium bovifimosum]KAJ5129481.1 hypothetical protein N7515_005520 [Penicillium bovifimosum]